MDEVQKISFVASLPSIQSAISVAGDGSFARLKLDIPQIHADVIPLVQMFFTNKAFVVTFSLAGDDRQAGDNPNRDSQD